ncbi:MAG: DUF1318 domain-containing protein [bacterium]
MKALLILIIISSFLLLSGCVKANVELGSQRTALENQILGSYKEIEEDVWMVASVRGTEPVKKVEMSDEKRLALEALNNRKFNKDDIDEFKASGYVGEGNRGYLVIIKENLKDIKEDEQKIKLIEDIIKEENRDRRVIMERVVAVNENLNPEDIARVEKIFANMNLDSEIKGNYIQLEDGKWVKKE